VAVHPDDLLREAEDEIEAWWCDLDAAWHGTIVEAEDEAARLVLDAQLEADRILAEAHEEFDRLHIIAGEHADAIRALAAADAAAARGVPDEHLARLREAVNHLRAELSRVVDAAFDALPAMEVTADALDRALGEVPEPELVAAAPPKRGFFRRLFSR